MSLFSMKLSPVERNYDIDDRKIQAIKLVLEEKHQWLEGAKHPFEVITGHRNLEFFREAKILNTCQARSSTPDSISL